MISNSISEAKYFLEQKELVAIPTETVYGLAANAFDEDAILKIYKLKQRPLHNPLIVHIKNLEFLTSVVNEIPPKAKILAEKFWPGPLTMILEKKEHLSDLLTAGKSTVAVRIPDHPVTLELLASLDFPLAAPSANPFGRISPTTAQHVEEYFKQDLKMVLEGGPCKSGVESTIVGFDGNRVILYRHGAISVEKLETAIGPISFKTKDDTSPIAPGMLSKHYSPRTKTVLTSDIIGYLKSNPTDKIGLLMFKDEIDNLPEHMMQKVLANNGDLELAASNLYAFMHELDNLNLDVIVAERLPETGLGKTINDRLQRAVED